MPAGPANPSDDDAPRRWSAQADSHFRSDGSHAADAAATPGTNYGGADVTAASIESLLRQAEEALATIDPADGLPAGAHPLELQDFAAASPHGELEVVDSPVPGEIELTIELGRVRLRVEDVLKLRKGTVAPLEPLVGAPVDVYAAGRLVARGDVLVLDGKFCVRVTETFHGDVAG